MIMINENWEQIQNPSDVIRIISENIGYEFARKVEEIFKCNEDRIEELEIDISELRVKEEHLQDLNIQLDILENYIDENKDGTDYMNGMIKAFNMIER